MHPHARRLATLAALPLFAAAFTACSNDEPDDSSSTGDGATWHPSSDVPTAPGKDGHTPPGAVLKAGETAHVTHEDDFADVPIAVELDVTASAEVTEVDVADLPEEQQDRGTPYYVRAEVSSTDPSASRMLITLDAVDGNGDGMDSWGSTAFEECSGEFPGAANGDTFEICTVVFGDSAPAAIGWEEAEAYDDDPVLWDLES